jgi:polyisoprenoid-binding protein YceI
VTFTANVFQCAMNPMLKKKQCGADLQTTIKRSDFGVKYGLPMLGDDVTLRIPVESIKD